VLAAYMGARNVNTHTPLKVCIVLNKVRTLGKWATHRGLEFGTDRIEWTKACLRRTSGAKIKVLAIIVGAFLIMVREQGST
jgi:hypothetical protein